MRDLPKRKKNRLQDFDYSSEGAYFITVCTKDRLNYFWENAGVYGTHLSTDVRPQINVCLSEFGRTAEKAINNIPVFHENVFVDKYVIMPNHIHLILFMENTYDAAINGRTMCAPTISLIVKQMKEYVTKQIGFSLWQKSFYDHVIRTDKSYKIICEYIDNNPLNWEDDQLYINYERIDKGEI